jgi:hypothetical protein
MSPVQRHVLDGKISLTDEVVLREFGQAEVELDGAQDRPCAARVGLGHRLCPRSARSDRVMPSGCPTGHCTSSMR